MPIIGTHTCKGRTSCIYRIIGIHTCKEDKLAHTGGLARFEIWSPHISEALLSQRFFFLLQKIVQFPMLKYAFVLVVKPDPIVRRIGII